MVEACNGAGQRPAIHNAGETPALPCMLKYFPLEKIMKILRIIVLLVLFAPFAQADSKLSAQELIQNLQSPVAGKRARAAEELGNRGEKPAMANLISATADKDPKVQLAAAQAISKIGTPDQVHGLSVAV